VEQFAGLRIAGYCGFWIADCGLGDWGITDLVGTGRELLELTRIDARIRVFKGES